MADVRTTCLMRPGRHQNYRQEFSAMSYFHLVVSARIGTWRLRTQGGAQRLA